MTHSPSRWRERVAVVRAHLQGAAELDARALALGRMGLALLLLYDLLIRSADISALYSDEGLEPRSVVTPPLLPLFRLYFILGTPDWTHLLFGLAAVSALALLLGYRTRVATALSWVLLASLQTRNGSVLQGGDDLLLMFLLWGLFLPLSRCWSIDAHRTLPASHRINGPAAFALYGQLFMLYFITGTLKLNAPHWRAGLGIADALSADVFVTAFGQWVLGHLTVTKFLSWGTLALEAFGPLLFLVPPRRWRVRLALVLTFLAFHAGISVCMRLGMFSFVCMVGWLFFLPQGFFDCWDGNGKRQPTKAEAWPKPHWAQRLCVGLFAYLVVAAMVADRWPHGKVRDILLKPARTFQLQETWGMFVKPREVSGFLVANALQQRGTQVDLMRAGAPLSWERPPLVIDLFANQRWRKMLTALTQASNKKRAQRYLDWLCRTENAKRSPAHRLVRIELTYVTHKVKALHLGGPDERRPLAENACPEAAP